MGKNVKRQKVQKEKQVAKSPIENEIKDDETPIFLFDCLDNDGKFAFNPSRKDFDAEEILTKIIHYSNMKWREIKWQTHDGNKSKHHLIDDVERICDEAKERLKFMQKEEESDTLFSFAFENKMRIWCLKSGRFFHILWYDPHHEVYPIKK